MPVGFLANFIVDASLAFGLANIILLVGLIYVYWGSYKEIKSGYTVGLLFFASIFLIQTVVLTAVIAFIVGHLENWFGFLGIFTVVFLEFIALSILLKISWG